MLYQINDNGRAVLCRPVRAMNEAEDLQRLLAENLFLLPGDQIDPESPRRWILVRREMPVPDPGGGGARWSVDLLVADQSGVPTFVECKRFADTRARREVVGQMLEYAANGHYYWDQAEIRRYLEESADAAGQTLQERFAELDSEDLTNVDELVERFVENLREGQVRLVFFMEKAPQELKSIVDFLNRQTERTEILIVEARQFDADGSRFVVPALFGYTEEARRAKRSVTVTSSGARKRWTREMYFDEVASELEPAQVGAIRSVFDLAQDLELEVRWGTGVQRGSMSLVAPARCARSFLSIYTDGSLTFNLGWLDNDPEAELLRAEIQKGVGEVVGLHPKDPESPSWTYPINEWAPRVERLLGLVRNVSGPIR